MRYEEEGRAVDRKKHWDDTYAAKAPDNVSWHRPHLVLSLDLIGRSGAGTGTRVIDVGGGASTLCDDLLDRGFEHITVLDVSGEAIRRVKERLGERAARVIWVEADVTTAKFPDASFDLWHDRAVFHFLTAPEDRHAYVNLLSRALAPGGHAIFATFALDGPEKCSGLNVMRYGPKEMCAELGEAFTLVESAAETHTTPWNTEQKFTYCVFRRTAAGGSGFGVPQEG
jgi:SAM-dependent methyltransferase